MVGLVTTDFTVVPGAVVVVVAVVVFVNEAVETIVSVFRET